MPKTKKNAPVAGGATLPTVYLECATIDPHRKYGNFVDDDEYWFWHHRDRRHRGRARFPGEVGPDIPDDAPYVIAVRYGFPGVIQRYGLWYSSKLPLEEQGEDFLYLLLRALKADKEVLISDILAELAGEEPT